MPRGAGVSSAFRITVTNVLLLAAFAVAWRLLSAATGLYDWEEARNHRGEPLRVILTCTLVSGVALAFPTISVTGAFQYSAIFFFWLGSILAFWYCGS